MKLIAARVLFARASPPFFFLVSYVRRWSKLEARMGGAKAAERERQRQRDMRWGGPGYGRERDGRPDGPDGGLARQARI